MYGPKYYRLAMGDPGFLGGLVKGIGKVAGLVTKTPLGKVASKLVPGLNIATTAMSLGGLAAKVAGKAVARVMPGAGVTYAGGRAAYGAALGGAKLGGGKLGKLALAGGGAAVGAGALGGLGQFGGPGQMIPGSRAGRGGGGRRYRRINPMNVKATRRAIRRIKGARKLLQSIERQLPKRRAAAPVYAFQRRRKRAA